MFIKVYLISEIDRTKFKKSLLYTYQNSIFITGFIKVVIFNKILYIIAYFI